MSIERKFLTSISELRKALSEVSVYDLNVYSAIELYYKISQKLNEVIKEVNRFEGVVDSEIQEEVKQIEYLLNGGLREEVEKRIEELYQEGLFEDLINKTLFDDINELLALIRTNKPKYIGSASHSHYTDDIENHLNHYKSIGCDLQLVCFVSVSDYTSSDFTVDTDKARQWLESAKVKGVNCSLMKVHLVVQNNDGNPKGAIKPLSGSEIEYFNGYKNALVQYLLLAREYGVEHFVFGNEISGVFSINNYPYYSSIISQLKGDYPNIKFGYSLRADEQEYIDSEISVLNLCDFIGFNLYPQVSPSVEINYNETKYTRMKSCYNHIYTANIVKARTRYGKPIWITEIGCTSTTQSLYNPLGGTGSVNDDVTGIYYDIAISVYGEIEGVDGFFIWSARSPFNFFNKSGEVVLKKYCEGR